MQWYCNPIAVEDYPMGHGGESDRQSNRDYRSLADPEVIRIGSQWFMFPTYALAWVSDDLVRWRHVEVEPRDVGPAPTILAYHGMFYLSGGDGPLYCANSPLGPYHPLGMFRKPDGSPLSLRDTMLFSDDDDRVYLYWGLGTSGVWGAELAANDLTQLICEPASLIRFDPSHEWERFGEHNQSFGQTYLEGAYLLKEKNRYYLVYSAPGTCYGSYCLAAYVSDEGPLSGFSCQKRNPILSGHHGLVRGPGHGSFSRAKDGSLWCFYTITLCYDHKYERRIAMDPAGVDENGELYVDGPSCVPRPAPDSCADNATLPWTLTSFNPVWASSCAPGRDGLYAVDESMLTWWQPAPHDTEPTLSVRLRAWYRLSGFRLIWRDVGLDVASGYTAGAFRFVIEARLDSGWVTVVNRSHSTHDFNCDFLSCESCLADAVRIRVLGGPQGITPGLIDFTAFGFFDHD